MRKNLLQVIIIFSVLCFLTKVQAKEFPGAYNEMMGSEQYYAVKINDGSILKQPVLYNEEVLAMADEQQDVVESSGFWGGLDVIKCGDAEIPAPIPSLTRIIVMLIKIAAPLVLIIMGMIDIVKAVSASDEKKIKEAQSNFVRRFIPAVLIFLVITIIQLLVGLVADNVDDSATLSKCIDCMITDESKCILVRGNASDNGASDGNNGEVNNNFPEYTSSNSHTSSVTGIKFKLYNQNDSRWGTTKYPSGKTIGDIGCLLSSAAVISSSHDSDITPKTVFDSKHRHSNPHVAINDLSKSNFSCKKVSYNKKQQYVNSLNSGNVLVIKVEGDSKFTDSQHYMALIDISSNGEKIFVGNSYGSGTGNYTKSGWFSTSTVLTDVHEVYSCKPSSALIAKFN